MAKCTSLTTNTTCDVKSNASCCLFTIVFGLQTLEMKTNFFVCSDNILWVSFDGTIVVVL